MGAGRVAYRSSPGMGFGWMARPNPKLALCTLLNGESNMWLLECTLTT